MGLGKNFLIYLEILILHKRKKAVVDHEGGRSLTGSRGGQFEGKTQIQMYAKNKYGIGRTERNAARFCLSERNCVSLFHATWHHFARASPPRTKALTSPRFSGPSVTGRVTRGGIGMAAPHDKLVCCYRQASFQIGYGHSSRAPFKKLSSSQSEPVQANTSAVA